ncbi:MAG TPA: hypothetical protein GXX39_02650 [Syntrophothermus lipocalidus]|uniref:Yip1 domain-containing protein n=1 Tax=Syntrophothermus lipocalidus (strain DSM 12680 / TGB-C1) TaxID=643648 RepID=D7CK67_SYNLT|nr:YIP1 family protein [Syntrophothermus lipocalidus]ADI03051.1 conserved hypothetical protein [Syntrophothermus lipocalidus DSM 12680]HHV76255.1 hypothetical protein [Syntrophothermus lipocalidus]HOV42462.1 YIP1 family protein [Syntrophothermus lipocalidus]
MRAHELVYGVFFNPAATFRYVGEEKPLRQVFAIWLAALGFGAVVSFSLFRGNVVSGLPPDWSVLADRVANFSLVYGVGYVVVSLLIWFVSAAVYSLASEVLYQRGNGRGLLAALALANLPSTLGPAFRLLGRVFVWESLVILLTLGICLWTVGLQVVALREALKVSTSQAIMLWAFPMVITGLLLVIMIVLLGVAAGGF